MTNYQQTIGEEGNDTYDTWLSVSQTHVCDAGVLKG